MLELVAHHRIYPNQVFIFSNAEQPEVELNSTMKKKKRIATAKVTADQVTQRMPCPLTWYSAKHPLQLKTRAVISPAKVLINPLFE